MKQKSTKERAIAGIFIWALLLLQMTMTHTITISLKVLLALKKAHTSVHGGYQPWQKKSGSGRFDFSWCKDRLDRIYGWGVILGCGEEIVLDGLVTGKTSKDFVLMGLLNCLCRTQGVTMRADEQVDGGYCLPQ